MGSLGMYCPYAVLPSQMRINRSLLLNGHAADLLADFCNQQNHFIRHMKWRFIFIHRTPSFLSLPNGRTAYGQYIPPLR